MWNVLFSFCIIAFFSFEVKSQELGLRFGDALGNKASLAIDAVFGLGNIERIHADLNFGGGVGIEALWDFIHTPIGGEAFEFYVGVGPVLFIGDDFLFGVSGEIGLEYHFNNIPVAIGGDWRPTLEITDETSFHLNGFGLNVRFVLNQ